jgi:hypothetical protein
MARGCSGLSPQSKTISERGAQHSQQPLLKSENGRLGNSAERMVVMFTDSLSDEFSSPV